MRTTLLALAVFVLPHVLIASNSKLTKIADACLSLHEHKACMKLAKNIWSYGVDDKKRILDLLDDQEALFIIASKEDWHYRIAAINKLTDISTLEKLVLIKGPNEARVAAIKRISDQQFLKTIAINETQPTVRIAAFSNILDQDFLENIVLTNHDLDTRLGALAGLKRRTVPQNIVAELYRSRFGSDTGVCPVANPPSQEKSKNNEIAPEPADVQKRQPEIIRSVAQAYRGPMPDRPEKYSTLASSARQALDIVSTLAEVVPFPYMKLFMECGHPMRTYDSPGHSEVTGESAVFTVRNGLTTLASATWATSFPYRLRVNTSYYPVDIDLADLVRPLLFALDATPGELFELNHSVVPQLAIIAGELEKARMRLGQLPTTKIKEQPDWLALSPVTKDIILRYNYVVLQTDQAALAKVAQSDSDALVRATAVTKLSDPDVVAHIATSDKSLMVRLEAEGRAKGLGITVPSKQP
jgi:hypothetical protein